MTPGKRRMLRIRDAAESDVPLIHRMLRDSAIAQGGEEKLCATPENLIEDGFGPHPRFHCLLAELDGQPVGLALYFFIYSTWSSRMSLYLEDLYVHGAARRNGVGRALMRRLARVALDAGCRQARWVVLEENSAAVTLYEAIGAHRQPDWSLMLMEESVLRAFANTESAPEPL